MNRNDIIRMAREAGFDFYDSMHVWTTPTKDVPYPEGVYTENLERFAALVAAAEREACAKVADYCQSALFDPMHDLDCAAAIRARGKE